MRTCDSEIIEKNSDESTPKTDKKVSKSKSPKKLELKE